MTTQLTGVVVDDLALSVVTMPPPPDGDGRPRVAVVFEFAGLPPIAYVVASADEATALRRVVAKLTREVRRRHKLVAAAAAADADA